MSIYLDTANEHLLVTTTGVCKFERFSGINVYHLFKKSIGMTFKNKKKEILKKMSL